MSLIFARSAWRDSLRNILLLRAHIVFLLWLFALGIVFVSQTVQAIEVKNSSYFPTFADAKDSRSEGWFLYTLKPGERIIDFVTVYNGSDSALSVRLYPADAVFTSEGAFSLAGLSKGENQTVGAWIKMAKTEISPPQFSQNERKLIGISNEGKELPILSKEELLKTSFIFLPEKKPIAFTVPPRERRIVPFEVTVPLEAEVGDHAGGIVVENQAVERRGNIDWVDRVGVRMYLTIPGQRIEKLELLGKEIKSTFQKLAFSVTLKNSGNVRLEPSFQFVIKNPLTGERKNLPHGAEGIIFPKQKTTYEIQFEKQGVGIFQYELYASTGKQTLLVAEGFYFPPLSLYIAGGLIAFLLLIFIVWFVRKRGRKKKKNALSVRGSSQPRSRSRPRKR